MNCILSVLLSLSLLWSTGFGSPVVEGDCVDHDSGLKWLKGLLSNQSAISCLGHPLQKFNSNRYWGSQYAKNASVVVFPGTTQDVSYSVQAAHISPLGEDFSFVGGAHGQINASSSYGFILDLSWLNKSRIIHEFEHVSKHHNSKAKQHETLVAVEYEGGATWAQVQQVTNSTGYTAVGARVGNVGVGGFSTGGGIGFLAGAYGYAVDRLVQLEVVLPCGKIVTATQKNEYSDLFWALQGGSGQFGIVTRFWQEAAAEPKKSSLGFYYIEDKDVPRLRNQTVDFFNNNNDPFSVIYYSFGYLSNNFANATPDSYEKRTLMITVHFENPEDPNQLDYEDTFRRLFSGINTTAGTVVTTDYYSNLCLLGEPAYPYGMRRGFYGPQTTEIDTKYLEDITKSFDSYIDELIQHGENPFSTSFIVQYMYPGLNGHLPKSDKDTAWPHSVSGHQTLFTPGYMKASSDSITWRHLAATNKITHDKQRQLGGFLGDYPNYISPGESGRRVWGDNVRRLMELKQKYDPECLIRNGRVFASEGCIRGGWANVYDN